MLFIETLLKKRYFTKPNGDTILDLTQSSINPTGENPTETSIVIVTEDEAMRPDLIAKNAYGDDGKLDYLLKYNGISNPFAIEAGDVLFVPDPFQMGRKIRIPEADSVTDYNEDIAEFNYFDENMSPENERIELLKRKAKNKEVLPPNVNQPGDTNVTYKDGKIIFGEDVTTVSKENCPETLTRARIKQNLLTSKIFK